MIKAITFDLWDTVIRDDSDESKRAAQGLPGKREARRRAVHAALDAAEPISSADLSIAYDTMEAAFNHVWHDQHVTWSVRERMIVLLRGLDRTLPESALAGVIRELEEMEVTIAPDPIEGIGGAIATLAEQFKLGVVSDAIYSPGRCLRRWLDMHGLLGYFGGFAFSDEVGHSKPHRAMFASVAEQLGVAVEDMVHIGDRDHNDIKGPHALGMKAVLFTAARDRDRHITSADAVCERAADLAPTIRRLAGL